MKKSWRGVETGSWAWSQRRQNETGLGTKKSIDGEKKGLEGRKGWEGLFFSEKAGEGGHPLLWPPVSGTGTGAPHSSSRSGGGSKTSQNATSNSVTINPRTMEDLSILPSPTSETVLTVAAFGVISFIVILVVVVIILVGVVSLRFKCRKNKESEGICLSPVMGDLDCSTANGEKDSITLISMKNINMNNSKSCPSAEKVHFLFPSFSKFIFASSCSYFQSWFPSQQGDNFQRPMFFSPLPYPAPPKKFTLSQYVFIFCRFFKSDFGPHGSKDDAAAP
uniref:Endothelial cell-specific chemotaxis regulator n=1 Tax=Sciurus vulgaris TaxID=55149 RepID=A0A8D2JFQ1_SCIVU